MALRSSPTPEPSDLKVKIEDSFDATGESSSLVANDQDRIESLRLKISSLGINGSESDADEEEEIQEANIKANQPSQPDSQAPLGRPKGGKGGFTLVSEHAEMLLLGKKYFIAFPNIYCFDTHRIICRVDSRARYHEADLKPNPPERETCFYIEGMPYWFDGANQLWYNIGGEWLPEVLHDDLSQARTELTHSVMNNRIDPMAGASTAASSSAGRYGTATNHNSEDEDVYPDYPLSPHPSQEEIDSWMPKDPEASTSVKGPFVLSFWYQTLRMRL
ncbi:hypothetical protein BDV93DRAFT_544508 [Ceratobasidium sp. AG-I]|nr:hypothetical protein BDV93DRAFT_544508 [Ceratobasidium sp. AG-I]